MKFSFQQLLLCLFFSLATETPFAYAQDVPADSGQDSLQQNSQSQLEPDGQSETEPDLCNIEPSRDLLPEKMQAGVHEFSCRAIRWFDSQFGDSENFREEDVGGKLSMSAAWNEFDKVEGRIRYRIKSDLPNLSTRWNAFFGKVEEDAFISNTETREESAFREGIRQQGQDEWLLGLGYSDRSGKNHGWDYSVGVRLRTPIRSYVKARYRKAWRLNEKVDLRFQQTVFWRDGTGFGTTTHIDTARALSERNVLRWELLGSVSESSIGTGWWAGSTWYHNRGDKRGISLLTFVRGETGTEVPLHEYGFELTWRRRIAREWLWINVGPTLTWPRLKLEEKREASVGFAVMMEFEFGKYRR